MTDPETIRAVAKAVEAAAKPTNTALEIVRDAGGYLSRVISNVPEDLVEIVGGAWLHEQHIRLRDKLCRRTEQIFRERDRREAVELSPNIAAAIIEGAQEESREDLAELWARLLASAMDPVTADNVRHSFIEAVKKMDPVDALVLRYIHERKIAVVNPGLGREPPVNSATGIENISFATGRRPDEIEVSLKHLETLSFCDHNVVTNPSAWIMNAVSREFMQACYP
jgi:hypothetical protein